MPKRKPRALKRREVLQQGTLAAAAALTAPPLARAATAPKVTTMTKPASVEMTAEDIRALLELEPNATCGFVRVTFLSKQKLAAGTLPAPLAGERPLGSALYFLVTPEAPVRLHRIRNDQLYHYYLGDPLELFLLHADGTHERVVVGPDLRSGQRVQLLIPGGTFHTARLAGGRWFLGASTEWPGVVPADVEIGNVEAMAAKYADIAADIRAIAASVRYVPPNPGAPR
jgi:predicted cupin superfamily sugar epimerase